ncbi:LapA family protein [Paenibacillus sp. sgz302251]|uniref:LapA family protein n=1 Tax=Paenibacillus sp. sgz302251 TaxID=3414493 RepID=UPI003C7E116D
MKGQGVLISALVFALLIAVFAVINVESVRVNFLFTEASLPLILVILISTLLSGLTIGLLGMIRQFRLQRTIKGLEKKVAELTEEVEMLGGMPTARVEPQEIAAEPVNN